MFWPLWSSFCGKYGNIRVHDPNLIPSLSSETRFSPDDLYPLLPRAKKDLYLANIRFSFCKQFTMHLVLLELSNIRTSDWAIYCCSLAFEPSMHSYSFTNKLHSNTLIFARSLLILQVGKGHRAKQGLA